MTTIAQVPQPTPRSTPQVLRAETLSFSFAATVISTLLQLASIQWPGAPTDFWWALGTSAVVGSFILIYQWPRSEPWDPASNAGKGPRAEFGGWWWATGREAFGRIGTGILNVLLVTAAVLGVGSAVESEPVTSLSASQIG